MFSNYNKYVTIQEALRLSRQIERYKPQIEQTLESVFVISKIISDEDDFELIRDNFPKTKVHYNIDNMSFEFKRHSHPMIVYVCVLLFVLGNGINLMYSTGGLINAISISF